MIDYEHVDRPSSPVCLRRRNQIFGELSHNRSMTYMMVGNRISVSRHSMYNDSNHFTGVVIMLSDIQIISYTSRVQDDHVNDEIKWEKHKKTQENLKLHGTLVHQSRDENYGTTMYEKIFMRAIEIQFCVIWQTDYIVPRATISQITSLQIISLL